MILNVIKVKAQSWTKPVVRQTILRGILVRGLLLHGNEDFREQIVDREELREISKV